MQKLFIALIILVAAPAYAEIILGPPNLPLNGGRAIINGVRNGESFTPTASEPWLKTASFCWGGTFNASLTDPPMIFNLFDGIGYGGTLLGTKSVPAIPDSTQKNTWIDFTFSTPIPLITGHRYTLEFTPPPSTSSYSGSLGSVQPYSYADGKSINGLDNTEDWRLGFDYAFRVLSGVSVPEPSSLFMLIIGIVGLGPSTIRRARQ